ncbi:hypothetical protein IJG29_02860 [Candidatus Saccharibacteria bacterium]|nr:hypothetical protein [Candidatus Saccharibacteria bacterium]
MKVIQNKLNKTKLVAGIAAILLFATIYNICKIPTSATAESNTSTYGLTATSESSLEISLVTPESPLSIKPTGGDGTFNSEQITVKVGTNNTTGYKLTMSADTTSLSRSPAGSGSIPTLESAVTEAEFPVNHWGFMRTTDNNTFQPMKAGEAIYINATGIQNDITESAAINNITFGVKLNNAIPMGNYSISLNFVATTNPVPMTMQDVTSSILAEYMPNIGDTYTLRDSRDGKDYKVARLATNQYWMAENLTFTGTLLTPTDSNVAENTTLTWYDSYSDGINSDGKCHYEYISGEIVGGGSSNPCSAQNEEFGGLYYNIFGVSAGTATVGVDGNYIKSMEHDICPAQWKLPNLVDVSIMIDSVGNANGILYFKKYGGRVANGQLDSAGSAHYWTQDLPALPYWGFADFAYASDNLFRWAANINGANISIFARCIFSGE